MRKLFWSKKWGKEKICNITFSRLRPGKSKSGLPYCITLECSHSFYTNALLECINNCKSDVVTCPVCRRGFDIFQIILKDRS